jgi:hypothetical protein
MSESTTRKAQEERAKRLRSTIEQVIDQGKGISPSIPVQESPRDFVHRRMIENARRQGQK